MATAFDEDLDLRISQRLIAVGGHVIVGTLDSSCSHSLISPGFAAKLVQRGYEAGTCQPFSMTHGKTLRGGGIREWVDVPIVVVHRGMVFRDDRVRLYVYDNAVGDVMLPPVVTARLRGSRLGHEGKEKADDKRGERFMKEALGTELRARAAKKGKGLGNAGGCYIQRQLRGIAASAASAAAAPHRRSRVALPPQHVCCHALSYLIVNCRKRVRCLC